MSGDRAGNPFRSLRGFNYRVWVAGAFVSNVGTWVQRTAQDWLVLTELTRHSASAVGLTMALQFGPQLVLLPWTGWAADRLDRRRLLLGTQAAMGALATALGVLTVTGLVRLWEVDGFALLFGIASAFDAPVRQIFVAELVGDAELPGAVAINSASFNAGRMIGPAAAGLVIGAVGTGWAFLFNGLSFVAVLGSLLRLRVGELHGQERRRAGPGSLAEGFRYVRGRPDLLAMLGMLFLIGTFGFNFAIFIATMAVGAFGAHAGGYGLLSSAMAVGTVSGALLGARWAESGFGALGAIAGLFGIGCGLAAAAPGYGWFALALPVIGVAALLFSTATNTSMQLSVEPAMRGRVMALRLAVLAGGTPVGAPVVGWVADRFGPRWGLAVGALSGFAAAAVAAWMLLRGRRMVAVAPAVAPGAAAGIAAGAEAEPGTGSGGGVGEGVT